MNPDVYRRMDNFLSPRGGYPLPATLIATEWGVALVTASSARLLVTLIENAVSGNGSKRRWTW
jgi:hypothetical protein